MAVYVSSARKKRRSILLVAAALLLGLVLGIVLGRATASGVSDAVASSQARGQELAAGLRTLPFEYEQLRSGNGSKDQASFLDAVDRIAARVPADLARAPWVGPQAKSNLLVAVENVRRAARIDTPPEAFRNNVEAAARAVEEAFDVRRTGDSQSQRGFAPTRQVVPGSALSVTAPGRGPASGRAQHVHPQVG